MRTYEKYKESGISWIGKVPDGWEVMKIKHIGKLYSGATPTTSNSQFWNGDIEWVTPVDINEKFIWETGRKITRDGYESCGTNMVEANSIIMSTRAPIGKVAINKVPVCTNQGCKSIVCNHINVGYCYYLLSTCTEELNFLGSGTTFLELSFSALANFEIPYPSLSEQEAIANYLDKKTAEIDKIIAEREKKIELLNELKSSIISRAVTKGINPHAKMKDSGIDWIGEIPEGWNLVRCKFLTKGYKSGPFGSSLITNKLLHDGHILVYTPEHVAKQSVNIDSNLFLPDERASEMSQFFVHPGEILFPIVGTLGRAMVITKDMPKGIINQRLAKFSINNRKLDTIFFLYLFAKCQSYQYYFYERCRGSIIVNLTKDILSDMPIVLPPLSEQVSIVNYLLKKSAEFDSTITSLKKECVLYKEYKQSLISEVVTGKRKVID